MSRSRTPGGPGDLGKGGGKDYEVGYGRPPIATRFRPGGNGNPNGRPKKKKTVGQRIEEALMTRVTIEENGRSKSMTAEDVIIRNLVHAAARRDLRAIHTLFALRDRYQDSAATTVHPADLATEDRQIIEEYLARLQSGVEPDWQAPKDGATKVAEKDERAPGKAIGEPDGSDGETP